MPAVLAILMSAVLFLHAVLGCCWHEGHDCGSGHLSCAPTLAGECGHRHHDDDSARRHVPCPGPCKCRLECQGAYAILPPQKTLFTKAAAVAPFDATAIIPTFAVSYCSPDGTRDLCHSTGESCRSVRLHLLRGILLI
jgi:hypothetical protein